MLLRTKSAILFNGCNLPKCDGLNSSLVLILHVFISNTNDYITVAEACLS